MTTRDDMGHETDDDSPFTEEARAQVVLAYLAHELADSACSFISAARHPRPDLVGDASRLATAAERLLDYAVVVARATGHSWETIGDELDVTKQSAQRKYAEAVARWDKAIAEPEGVDDYGRTYSRLPHGADDTVAIAARLDDWAIRHREPGKSVRGEYADAPVSGGLRRMGPLEEMADIRARARRLMDGHIYPAEQLAPLYEREAVLADRLADAGVDPATNRRSAAKSREMAARARAYISAALLVVSNDGIARSAGRWDAGAGAYRCSICPALNHDPAVATQHAEVAHGVDQLPDDPEPGNAVRGKATDRKTTSTMSLPLPATPARVLLVDLDSQNSAADTIFNSPPQDAE